MSGTIPLYCLYIVDHLRENHIDLTNASCYNNLNSNSLFIWDRL